MFSPYSQPGDHWGRITSGAASSFRSGPFSHVGHGNRGAPHAAHGAKRSVRPISQLPDTQWPPNGIACPRGCRVGEAVTSALLRMRNRPPPAAAAVPLRFPVAPAPCAPRARRLPLRPACAALLGRFSSRAPLSPQGRRREGKGTHGNGAKPPRSEAAGPQAAAEARHLRTGGNVRVPFDCHQPRPLEFWIDGPGSQRLGGHRVVQSWSDGRTEASNQR